MAAANPAVECQGGTGVASAAPSAAEASNTTPKPFMGKLLEAFFAGLIKTGSIEIETAGGPKFILGDGSGTKLGLRFTDKALPAFLCSTRN
jgi:hypothetical protein